MKQVDFVIPSFHSREMTECALKSFIKYESEYVNKYIVIENSDDISYRDNTLALCNKIVWVQNQTIHRNSDANASALEVAKNYIEAKYVFVCHNDVVATHPKWLSFLFLKLHENNNVMAGTVRDPTRINAVHISGLLTYSNIFKSTCMWPQYDSDNKIELDVGDLLTKVSNDNNTLFFCCKNTFNEHTLIENLTRFKNFHVDRALNDDGEIIFMHLGRGIQKLLGAYDKPNRVYHDEWIHFVKENIL